MLETGHFTGSEFADYIGLSEVWVCHEVLLNALMRSQKCQRWSPWLLKFE